MRTIIFALIIAPLIGAPNLFAGIVVPQSLATLEREADLIVVGSATGGNNTGSDWALTIQVSRVVKGDSALAGQVIPAAWTSPAGRRPVPAGASLATNPGLWFLKRSSSAWGVLPWMQGDVQVTQIFIEVPAGPIAEAYSYGRQTAVLDSVASEVCAAIEGGVPAAARLALDPALLDELNSPAVHAYYQRAATSTEPGSKILGLSGLIRSGDATALRSAMQSLPVSANYQREYGVLLSSVRHEFRSADSASVTALGQAISGTSIPLPFRRAAARALAAIHNAATLPYLAMLLDDPDFELRVEAIGGLGAFANGLPVQTTADVPSLRYLQLPKSAPYMTSDTIANLVMRANSRNEVKYLSFWKTWWLQHRSELGY
jgi:hypothetical protein